jgi:hypothetical protein
MTPHYIIPVLVYDIALMVMCGLIPGALMCEEYTKNKDLLKIFLCISMAHSIVECDL